MTGSRVPTYDQLDRWGETIGRAFGLAPGAVQVRLHALAVECAHVLSVQVREGSAVQLHTETVRDIAMEGLDDPQRHLWQLAVTLVHEVRAMNFGGRLSGLPAVTVVAGPPTSDMPPAEPQPGWRKVRRAMRLRGAC